MSVAITTASEHCRKPTSPKRHLALPATTDYWVNDATGDPLFVVTAAANAGMFAMLPRVLEEVRTLVGAASHHRL